MRLQPTEQLDFFDILEENKPKPEVRINQKALDRLGLTATFPPEGVKVTHPLMAGMDYREYQVAIAAETTDMNVLAVLPTGLGKTNIAVLAAARQMIDHPKKKILVLAPTKPLAEQHAETFQQSFPDKAVACLTGHTGPEKRGRIWTESDVIVATSQTILNDIAHGRLDMSQVSIMVVDEAHHTTKNYPYVEIAKNFSGKGGRILGLTASPGADADKIKSICLALGVKSSGIEIRTREDPDVEPYVQYNYRSVIKVPRQGVEEIEKCLRSMYYEAIADLRQRNLLDKRPEEVKTEDLLEAGRGINKLIAEFGDGYSDEKGEALEAKSVHAEAMKLSHALRVLTTHGLYTTSEYLKVIRRDRTQASERIFDDARMTEALGAIDKMLSEKAEFPKMDKAMEIVSKYKDGKVIVFTEYRKTVEDIIDALKDNKGILAQRFIGQAGRDGMSQTEQQQALREFKDGKFNVLVATSVGEEGLDIPEVDAVVFFEPVSDERRLVQREGRTGRHKPGATYVLMAEGTMDEGLYYKGYWQWKKMKHNIDLIKKAGLL